jgi:hypothetical protein
MAINSKNKGSSWERAFCKILKERFPGRDFSRVPTSGAFFGKSNKEKRSLAEDNVKEVLSGDVICPSEFKFSVECKSYAEISFWDLFNESSDLNSWIKQCSEDSEFVNKVPLLAVKINNHKPFVATTLNLPNQIFTYKGFNFFKLDDFLKFDDTTFFES